jgi:ABC-type Na+ efflux pump permease subunit
MLPNKRDYAGLGMVFRFSLQQYFKNKATFVMLLVMLLGSVGSVFIMSASMKRGANSDRDARMVYVLNESPYVLDMEELPDYTGLQTVTGSGDDWLETVNREENSVLIWIDGTPEGTWRIRACTGENSKVGRTEANRLGGSFRAALQSARLRASGAPEEQLALAMAPWYAETVTQQEYLEPEDEEQSGGDTMRNFIMGFLYAMVTYMLVGMSVSYVVRAVAEEKSSKLVDLLMVSVRPLALVWGKILAAMCVVLAGILLIGLGMGVSRAVLGVGANDLAGGLLSSALSSLNPWGLVCILVSLVLGYLSYSILGGIAGSAVSGEDGVDSAAGSVMLMSMVGYLAGILTSFSDSRALQTVVSLVPLISAFTAPARYLAGQVDLWVLLLSWLIQSVTVLLLGRFCAAVYGALLIYKGDKLKLRRILGIFRQQKGVRT